MLRPAVTSLGCRRELGTALRPAQLSRDRQVLGRTLISWRMTAVGAKRSFGVISWPDAFEHCSQDGRLSQRRVSANHLFVGPAVDHAK